MRQRRAGDHGRAAAVHLERADRRDDDGAVRRKPRGAALYVYEFLEADVGAEARLRARACVV